MQKVTVKVAATPKKDCVINIGIGAIENIGSLYDLGQYSKVFVVTDKTVKTLLLKKLVSALPVETAVISLPSGEKQKTIGNIQKIWTALHDAGCDRKSLVINLGGGVIGDTGGFAASTYMRGIDFLNVPTTLLAQVDSSVGGKTGFNFAGIKNLIGTFQQPIGVIIDPQTLATLPESELLSGFAEIIKHGLIWDKGYFEQVTAKHPSKFTQAELVDIITQSCQIKAEIVQGDQTENGIRKLVNYGHTIGHAIESLGLEMAKPLLHGEAISVGMRGEAIIAQRQKLISAAELRKIERAFVKAGLPITVQGFKGSDILKKMQSDKKTVKGEVNFVLLDGIGRALYDQKVDMSVVKEAIRAVTQKTA